MLTNIRKKTKAFTTVEILVAVGLVAILMVVAVPRLLGSRQSVGDSAAKQQLNTVGVSVNNWFVERDTFTGLTVALLGARVPEIELTLQAAGKRTNGRALTVSFQAASGTAGSATDFVILAASNGDNNCWATKYSKNGVEYKYSPVGTGGVASCSASLMSGTGFVPYEFPNATN
jgi:type II secretory pathway pseudopilin PulG